VLDGDGINKGVLYVISKYGDTKSGNLAHYYAGISYLKLGNFNKAVEHLKDFSTSAKQIQMVAYGAVGDAYSELKKNDDAISYYTKAGKTFEKDEFSSSEYLFRAGLLSETTGKTKDALELYKEIKAKFPKTDKGMQIDKYIYRLSIEKNDLSIN
jgi:tetratricopeptide (TPR) repeat protein